MASVFHLSGAIQGLQSAVLLLLPLLTVCAHLETITAVPHIVCQEPKEPGICTKKLSRYYYDPYRENCRHFYYGGCGGNGNRFDSREKCQIACQNRDVCNQTVDPGRCKVYMPSYFYNSTSETCERFIYGGCGGNGNRFDSDTACHAVCLKDKLCQELADHGPCKGFMHRYYYNATTATCEKFIYGGCGGNDNRFRSKKVCRTVCSNKKVILCDHPPETGMCKLSIPSYYYNSTMATCQQFIYGGCGGNANRFDTLEECQTACV